MFVSHLIYTCLCRLVLGNFIETIHDFGICHNQLGEGNLDHILFNPDTDTFCLIDFAEAEADHACDRRVPLRDLSSRPFIGAAGCRDIDDAGIALGLWCSSMLSHYF
jgi:hypothetical protein